jgi:hypothetical protein
MFATDHSVSDLPLPALELRSLARRLVVPALLATAAVAVVVLAGGRVHAFTDAMERGLRVSPGWAAVSAVFEFVSLAGYVALLSLVAGRATPRVGSRESAQITLAGIAATRLLPTAGAGGAALTLWALRRAGLKPMAATRTLLGFLVVLYAVFLVSIVLCGAALAFGLVPSQGPTALSAVPAIAATLGIALALALAFGAGVGPAIAPRPTTTGAALAVEPVRDCSLTPFATLSGWSASATLASWARSRTGSSTRRSCGRCSTHSARRPPSRPLPSRTSSARSRIRFRFRAP